MNDLDYNFQIMLIDFGCHFLLKSTKLPKKVKISIVKKHSPNHCFSKSPKYGGNTKKRGFTIDNAFAIKKSSQLHKIQSNPTFQ